jgi:hypothetical protein
MPTRVTEAAGDWVGRSGLVAALLAACASAPPPPPPPPPPTAQTVSAIVVANGCAALGPANAKLAEKAMDQLVVGCGGFTGKPAHFTATLLAGGAIQFEARGGEAEAVPICALSHPLTHAVKLAKPCALDVKLEASSMTLPAGSVMGAAPDGTRGAGSAKSPQ